MSTSKSKADIFLSSSAHRLAKIPKLVANHRLIFSSFFLCATVALLAGLPHFKLNQSMEAFFLKNDETMLEYRWFKHLFGSDEFVLVMYQPKDGDVFSPKSLRELDLVEKELNHQRLQKESPLKRITRIRTIISADWLESENDSLISRPLIGDELPKTPEDAQKIKNLALTHRQYPGSMFSKDTKAAVIMIETDFGSKIVSPASEQPEPESSESDFSFETAQSQKAPTVEQTPQLESVPMSAYTPFISALNAVLEKGSFSKHNTWNAAGNPWIMNVFNNVILKEIGQFSGFSIAIIWIVLLFAFRSLTALLWPTVTLVLSMGWLMGLIGWSGIEMTFMINIMTFLLLSISMATSIHILSGYKIHLAESADPLEALSKTYFKSGVPIVLAGLTTAIGLISLIFVPVLAIKNFGIFASIGVIISLTLNLALWPLLLSIWAPKLPQTPSAKPSGALANFLAKQRDVTLKHPKVIVAVFLGIFLVAGMGIPKVFINTNFVTMVKEGYGLQEGYRLIDKYFGGTMTIEIMIDTDQQDGIKDAAFLKAVDNFSEEIKILDPAITQVRSILDVAKESHKTLLENKEEQYRIPDTKNEVSEVLFSFESADPKRRQLLVENNWQLMRLTISTKTHGSHYYLSLMEKLKEAASKHLNPLKPTHPNLKVYYTGGVPLSIKLVNLVSISQIRSFSLALAVICFTLFLVFSSFKFGILATIPNIFPLVIVMGYAGWAGVPMDSDTLLVIPIAIGIAVDDTIHFLTHIKHDLVEGESLEDALQSAITKVGQAMTFTSVVLTFGFSIFLISAYNPLGNFGILSAMAIFSALFADIYLLPVLIRAFGIRGKEKSPELNATSP